MSLPNASSSKVAIPRLPQKRGDPQRKEQVMRPGRVSRACANCRARKIKCNGARPACAACSSSGTTCIYPSTRRDRLKTATGHNQEMIELLQNLRSQVSEGSRHQIDNILESVFDDVTDAAQSLHRPYGRHDQADEQAEEQEEEDDQGAATMRPGDVGSRQNFGAPPVPAPKSGGIYQSSQTAPDAVEHGEPRLRPVNLCSDSMQTDKTGFFLDDDLLDLNTDVDPFEVPPFWKSDSLSRTYLESSHNLLPLLAKKAFTDDFNKYYAARESGGSYQPSRDWQVQLNLVFAIASVHCSFSSTTGGENAREHLLYHARALALNEKRPVWFSRPNLPQMQTIGLLSFYYLSTGFIDRSWALSGLALRFGFAIGLHSRSEDYAFGAARKEEMARIWWAHFALERLLSAMTGRPSIGVIRNCPVPLPLCLSAEDLEDSIVESRSNTVASYPADQASGFPKGTSPDVSNLSLEPANSGSYLKSLVQLSEITQESLALYATGPVEQTWRDVQEGIQQLTSDLERWVSVLPSGLNFLESGSHMPRRYARERNSLDILYHGTIILVTRPFLCRPDRLNSTQTAESNEMSKRCALACVESAKSVAGVFPEGSDFDLALLYNVGPWWNMSHILVQSFTILLLEMIYEPVQLPHDRREIMLSLKKLLRWLRAMQTNSLVAARAYIILMKVIRAVGSNTNMDVTDLLSDEEQASSTAHTSEGGAPAAHEAQDFAASNHTFDRSTAPRSSSRRPTPLVSTHSVESMSSTSTTQSVAESIGQQDLSRSASIASSLYLDLTFDQSGTGTPALSGLFVTIFDQDNPLSRLRAGATATA